VASRSVRRALIDCPSSAARTRASRSKSASSLRVTFVFIGGSSRMVSIARSLASNGALTVQVLPAIMTRSGGGVRPNRGAPTPTMTPTAAGLPWE
jgi:hypothetical protein